MEQEAFTEEQETVCGDPFMDLDNKSVVDDAGQRARAVIAVMTAAAGSGNAEKRLDGSSVGRRPNVDRGFDKGFARLTSHYVGVNSTCEAFKRFRKTNSRW
jgi:hypothetical protein